MPIHENRPVFACAPSAYGFRSLFDEIFRPEDYKRMYILKGSCGSGKSHIIKKLAAECDERKLQYELFYCSFDPDSCDGIIISNLDTCVVDGTSPHVTEPVYPGAVEVVVNTSDGLNEDRLPKYRNEIISLCRKKSESFEKSYSFFRAALEIENNLTDIITENFQFGKMFSAIKRFCERNFKKGSGFCRENRLTSVYCKYGICKSDAFFSRASKKCLVADKFGVAHILLNEILKSAIRFDMPVQVSLSSLDFKKIDGLYLPGADMAFHVSPECERRDDWFHVFNMARFVDKNNLRQSKYKIRFLKKCFAELTNAASESLGEAYDAHTKLENIYSRNTDYTKNDLVYDKLRSAVFDTEKH